MDLGYRGHCAPEDIQVYHRNLKRSIKRRSAIEPIIGHMKNDGRLRRNVLERFVMPSFAHGENLLSFPNLFLHLAVHDTDPI